MNKSESTTNLFKALQGFQSLNLKVKKTSDNPYFKSKYADLSSILDVIVPELNKAGLAYTQMPDGKGLTTILMHPESGEWIEASYELPVKETLSPQAYGASMTYARRYVLCAMLGLNITDDDDANSATDPKLPLLTVDSAAYKYAVKHLAEGGSLKDITAKYIITESVKTDLDQDVANYNDPLNPGQREISKKIERVGK